MPIQRFAGKFATRIRTCAEFAIRPAMVRGVGQGLFAESAMVMCIGFNCIPCMQKTALSSVLATPAQKRPFYELSPDTVQDVFYVLWLCN